MEYEVDQRRMIPESWKTNLNCREVSFSYMLGPDRQAWFGAVTVWKYDALELRFCRVMHRDGKYTTRRRANQERNYAATVSCEGHSLKNHDPDNSITGWMTTDSFVTSVKRSCWCDADELGIGVIAIRLTLIYIISWW